MYSSSLPAPGLNGSGTNNYHSHQDYPHGPAGHGNPHSYENELDEDEEEEVEEEVVQVINNLEGKANCIYGKLTATAVDDYNIMHQTFVDFSDIQYYNNDLIYTLEAGLVNSDGEILNAKTTKDGEKVTITLNSDRIQNRSSIEIAKTIIHESIHAGLKRQFSVYPNNFINNFKKYIEAETGSNDITHAIMRDHYIEPMVKNLQQYDEYREDDEFYRNLAWEGLHQYLPDEDINEIITTQNEAREREGGMSCGNS